MLGYHSLGFLFLNCKSFYPPGFLSFIFVGVYIPPQPDVSKVEQRLAEQITCLEGEHADSLIVILRDFFFSARVLSGSNSNDKFGSCYAREICSTKAELPNQSQASWFKSIYIYICVSLHISIHMYIVYIYIYIIHAAL